MGRPRKKRPAGQEPAKAAGSKKRVELTGSWLDNLKEAKHGKGKK